MSKKSEIKTDSGFPVKEVYNRKDISREECRRREARQISIY